MENYRNARFWTMVHGSPVKLTLKYKQTLSHIDFNYHDEGWTREVNQWFHRGDAVDMWITGEGRDCDGRTEWSADLTCDIDELADHLHVESGIAYPSFKHERSSQRDHSAEAMGY